MFELFIDPLGGASGDMFLSALIDLGADKNRIVDQLESLKLAHRFKMTTKQCTNRGFAGLKTTVELEIEGSFQKPESRLDHHSHTSFKSIRQMIECSDLSNKVKADSIKIFTELARAEAEVHGKSLDDVSFHEVGAVDSIVDIVGTALALEQLGIQNIYSSSVGVGSGSVECAHGWLPVPAPATMILLKGLPVYQTGENKEMCTPTGAAILKALASFSTPEAKFQIEKIGMGISHSTPQKAPPFLRCTLAKASGQETQSQYISEQLLELSCTIDDMEPEYLSFLCDQLMKAGALDVNVCPTVMKKGRSGHEVKILTEKNLREKILSLVFENSTSFGVRLSAIERISLSRTVREVETQWGQVKIKEATLPSGEIKQHIEFEDVKRICEKHQLSWKTVLKTILKDQ